MPCYYAVPHSNRQLPASRKIAARQPGVGFSNLIPSNPLAASCYLIRSPKTVNLTPTWTAFYKVPGSVIYLGLRKSVDAGRSIKKRAC